MELRLRSDELERGLREAGEKLEALHVQLQNERQHKIGLALSRQVCLGRHAPRTLDLVPRTLDPTP